MKCLLALLLLIPLAVECYKALSTESLKHLAQLTDAQKLSVNGELMKPLLVERISGTPENEQVQKHIISHFERLGWHIELDRFTDSTPFGTKNFTNIIVTHNPDKPTRLVLAAHFDSKYSADFEFIGATDSAIPCGLLMDLAETLNEVLSNTSKNYRQKEKTVQMIFFDGEEAFHQWGPTDSIYGARHLAESWETAYLAHGNKVYKNKLDQIEVLVLLDLLGVTNTRFPNYYRTTSWLFYKLVSLETRLRRQSLFKEISEKTGERLESLFHPDSMLTFRGESIADDHVPFLMRGVNVLHLIPYPFPYVWHTRADTADCIDPSMVENLSVLFRTFTAEYLELDPLPHNEL